MQACTAPLIALRQITGKTLWIYSFAHTVAAPPFCMNKLKAALILHPVHMTYSDGWFDKGYSVWIKFVSYRYSACLQAWGKQFDQMLEALPQVLGKVLKHKCKYFNKANASSTK